MHKLFVLDRNTWIHINVHKLFVLDRNLCSSVYKQLSVLNNQWVDMLNKLTKAKHHFCCLEKAVSILFLFFNLKKKFFFNLPSHLTHFILYFGSNPFMNVFLSVMSNPCDIVVNVPNCTIIVNEFKLQSCYYVYFLINTLGKGMYQLFPTSGYGLNSTTTVSLQGRLWH